MVERLIVDDLLSWAVNYKVFIQRMLLLYIIFLDTATCHFLCFELYVSSLP